jgi:hypothetical protein
VLLNRKSKPVKFSLAQILSALSLKSLRPEQRVDQVPHDETRHDESDDIFQSHIDLLQTIAAADVEPRDDKKHGRNDDESEINHLMNPQNDSAKTEIAQAACQIPGTI